MNDFILKQPKDSFFRKQFESLSCENICCDYENEDPLFEDEYKVTPFLIHRYKNRVLLLTTKFCSAYCRHCFRKSILPQLKTPQFDDYLEAAKYVREHLEVEEILFSGGDPLILLPEELLEVLKLFNFKNRFLKFRICTRVPVVNPYLVSEKMLSIFDSFGNGRVRFSIQINHSDELTSEFRDIVKRIRKRGYEVLSQTVLLRGINDSLEVLEKLYVDFFEMGISPYYLFQGDLAKKTKCYRTSIKDSLDLFNALKKKLPESYLPVFALDLPNGGGKVPVREPYFLGMDKSYAFFKNSEDIEKESNKKAVKKIDLNKIKHKGKSIENKFDGKIYKYPIE